MRRLSADPTLHFFCGKVGAGKTTVASHLAQDQNAILISEDIWLLRLFGDEMKTFEDYIRVSQKLKTVVGPLTVDLLNAGQSVVLDFQAIQRQVAAGSAQYSSRQGQRMYCTS